MAFEVLKHNRTERCVARLGVWIAIYTQATEKRQVSIYYGPEVLAKLGWKICDRVEVAEGTGTDSGVFQIKKSERHASGTYAISAWTKAEKSDAGGTRFNVDRLLHHIVQREGSHSLAECEFQAFGGSLLIMLPDFFQASDT